MKCWEDFDKFDDITDKYISAMGQGNSKASQLCTAISNLIYKYFNDGDVYDNTGKYLEGWENDVSCYANWLYKHFPYSREILDRVYDADDGDYTEILYELASTYFDEELLQEYAQNDVDGNIYKCDGKFRFE